ncbi:MAG: EAL domain-containing protein [Bermanella sp.]
MNHDSKVLIVDDNQANRFTLETLLESLRVSTFQANSGDEALKQVLQHDFAVILLDAEIPGMDGYETAKLIHDNKHYKDVPIVMVTARDNSKEQYLKAYEAGAVDFITKPIEPIILINKVKQFVDLHVQRRTAQRLQLEYEQASARMQALLNSAGEGILGIDLCGNITFANPKAAQILQIEQDLLLDKNLHDFLDSQHQESVTVFSDKKFEHSEGRSDISELLKLKTHSDIKKERWLTATGSSFYVEFSYELTRDHMGKSSGGVLMFQNVSERREIEKRLIRLANFDPLTNLANRAYFHDAMGRAIARCKRSHNILGLLFLDLDHFKHINDSLGHDAGDMLLQFVGERISESVRAGDLTARLGGDEFAVILHDLNSITAAAHIAEKIISSITKPVDLQGNRITASISIGIAIFDENTMALDELTKAADTAMYAAKHEGRNNFQFFDPEMQKRAEEKNKIQITLHQAMHNNELSMFFQPKVDISLNKIVGMEALIRWTTLDGRRIPPDVFIPIAEESGQILELGEWVFKQVCQQITKWKKVAGFNDLVISVNVSAIQLKTGNFHELVKASLEEFDISPHQLDLELTETAVMSNPQQCITELEAIHKLGVQISIDDFGTGYSSLNYLKRFPIDTLKIDRCFIKDIGEDKYDEEIIKVMVAIGHTMGIKVVAEGVETQQQLEFLRSIGCDQGQGYFFSKPMDAAAATEVVENIQSDFSTCMDEINAFSKNQEIQVEVLLKKSSEL